MNPPSRAYPIGFGMSKMHCDKLRVWDAVTVKDNRVVRIRAGYGSISGQCFAKPFILLRQMPEIKLFSRAFHNIISYSNILPIFSDYDFEIFFCLSY